MFIDEFLAHKNNLQQKLKVSRKLGDNPMSLVEACVERYEEFLVAIDYEKCADGDMKSSVDALNDYLDFAKAVESKHKIFNWRSNFAGSIIPEFLYRIIHYVLADRGLEPLFTTKKTVVEIAYTGNPSQPIRVRHKDQDFGIGFTFGQIVEGDEIRNFVIPILVFEVKTNIDINKLNGLEFSANSLKNTFPNSTYFLVTETIDFSLSKNYESGDIDEVYVLRKQLRTHARKHKEPLKADVFEALLTQSVNVAMRANLSVKHVYKRLPRGRLING